MGKILLSIALSIDGLGLGASLGMTGTRITKMGYAAVFAMTFLMLKLAVFAGKTLGRIIPEQYMVFAGSGILIALGIYLILQKAKSMREKADFNKIESDKFQFSWKCDMDNSGSIEMVEGIFLAAALSADVFGAGIGLSSIYSDLGMLPVLISVFQSVFLYAGCKLGGKIMQKRNNCFLDDLISAGVLIAIGIAGIKTGGKLI